jgi:DNA-3-methyladenine glycosylase I
VKRCFGDDNALMARYHDREWGRPRLDDRRLYEKLCLEAFQVGISWSVVLGKRKALRAAFAGFDPQKVAGFGGRDVARLLRNAEIIRNRAKIEAAIANAKATIALHRERTTLAEVVWAHLPRGRRRAPRSWSDVPAITEESTALAATLRGLGFKFVGPTTAYATMQAVGMVNDHLIGCSVRSEVEAAQRAAQARLV